MAKNKNKNGYKNINKNSTVKKKESTPKSSRVDKNKDLYSEDFTITKQQEFDFSELNMENTLDISFMDIKKKKKKSTPKEKEQKSIKAEKSKEQKPIKVENSKEQKSEKKLRTALLIIIIISLCLFVTYHFVTFNHNKVKEVTKIVEKVVTDENIVFLGDSITEGYDLKKYYSDNKVVNSGISGNITTDILDNMKERVYQFNPSKVFLLIGTNDIHVEKSEEEIADNIEKIIKKIKENRPYCEIYLESIYPVNTSDDEKTDKDMVSNRTNEPIKKINDKLKKIAKSEAITYIDMYKILVDEDDNLKLEYTKEGLHMSDKGYEVITNELKKYLQ